MLKFFKYVFLEVTSHIIGTILGIVLALNTLYMISNHEFQNWVYYRDLHLWSVCIFSFIWTSFQW